MNWKRWVSRALSETNQIRYKTPRPGRRVLMYHSIGGPTLGSSAFTISENVFREQVAFMCESGFRVVDFMEALPSINKMDISLTFDDGYRDNLRIVAPILAKLGIPFTVFVSTQMNAEGFLARDEICELSRLPGVRIGSNGVSHCRLTAVGNPKLKFELRESKRYLEDTIGRTVDSISFPHGAVDTEVLEETRRTGYLRAGTSVGKINSKPNFLLGRNCIMAADNLRVFRQKIYGAWDWHALTQLPVQRLM